jgi:polyisoprenoid-binding protein YceI
MKRCLGSAVLFFALAAPALAASWSVDTAHSKLGFSGTQTGETFSGTFKAWTAAIDYDPAKPEAAHIVVTVDMASATTGDQQRDEALPGEDWFDIAKFPKATFEATGFKPKGGDAFDAPGKLAIRGISKDITLPFNLTVAGNTAHAVGKVNLLRNAFDVGQGNWASDQYVAFEVNVDVDLTATRQP